MIASSWTITHKPTRPALSFGSLLFTLYLNSQGVFDIRPSPEQAVDRDSFFTLLSPPGTCLGIYDSKGFIPRQVHWKKQIARITAPATKHSDKLLGTRVD